MITYSSQWLEHVSGLRRIGEFCSALVCQICKYQQCTDSTTSLYILILLFIEKYFKLFLKNPLNIISRPPRSFRFNCQGITVSCHRLRFTLFSAEYNFLF